MAFTIKPNSAAALSAIERIAYQKELDAKKAVEELISSIEGTHVLQPCLITLDLSQLEYLWLIWRRKIFTHKVRRSNLKWYGPTKAELEARLQNFRGGMIRQVLWRIYEGGNEIDWKIIQAMARKTWPQEENGSPVIVPLSTAQQLPLF